MTNQTPAPDAEWLDKIFGDYSAIMYQATHQYGLHAENMRERASREAKAAILQEIQNHDRQLLDRIVGALPEERNTNKISKKHGELSVQWYNAVGCNSVIDQVKAIINQERGKL